MFDACIEEPEIAWQAIIQILQHELTNDQIGMLAAGPLETLLASHGLDFIDRVIDESKKDARVVFMLGIVHRRDMPKEVLEKIRNLLKTKE